MSATLTGTGWLVDPIAGPVRTLPPATWATLPPASSNSGLVARVTDVGVAPGIQVVSDGTRWVPMGPQLLARGNVASSVTGTVSETTLATVSIPAGAMGINGGVEFRSVWSVTNSANNKTLRTRLGGLAGTAFFTSTVTASASYTDQRCIRNRNVANSQIGGAITVVTGPSTGAVATGSVDTSVAQDLVFSGQLANTGETIALESYEVWLLP